MCIVSYAGSGLIEVNWYNSSNAIVPSVDRAEVLTYKQELRITGSLELDQETFTCKVSVGDLESHCQVTLDVLCKYSKSFYYSQFTMISFE